MMDNIEWYMDKSIMQLGATSIVFNGTEAFTSSRAWQEQILY